MASFYDLRSAALTHKGRKRPNNQDFVGKFEPTDQTDRKSNGSLFIVADGVGGASKGELASEHAVQTILYEYYQHAEITPQERLIQTVRKANSDMYQYAEETGRGRMATTVVAALVLADKLTIANVGDSRAYLIRGGQVTQLTRDHSIVGEMTRYGTLSEAEAMTSKVKNRLTRSVGGDPDVHVDLFADIPIIPGDRILLCSDGLTRYALRQDIADLTAEGTSDQVAQRCIDFALNKGGADNVSAIVIEVMQASVPTLVDAVVHPSLPPRLADRQTETEAWAKRRRKTFLSGLSQRERGVLTVLGLGGLAVLIIIGLVVLLSTSQLTSPEQTGTAQAVAVSMSQTVTHTPTLFGPTGAPLVEGGKPTDTPTLTETVTPTSTDTETITVSPTVSKVVPNGVCVVKVKPGDWLGKILPAFNLNYNPNEAYLYHQSCDTTSRSCSDAIRIPNPDKISAGWWINIAGDQRMCIGHDQNEHQTFWLGAQPLINPASSFTPSQTPQPPKRATDTPKPSETVTWTPEPTGTPTETPFILPPTETATTTTP